MRRGQSTRADDQQAGIGFTCRARLNDRPTAKEAGGSSAPCLVEVMRWTPPRLRPDRHQSAKVAVLCGLPTTCDISDRCTGDSLGASCFPFVGSLTGEAFSAHFARSQSPSDPRGLPCSSPRPLALHSRNSIDKEVDALGNLSKLRVLNCGGRLTRPMSTGEVSQDVEEPEPHHPSRPAQHSRSPARAAQRNATDLVRCNALFCSRLLRAGR